MKRAHLLTFGVVVAMSVLVAGCATLDTSATRPEGNETSVSASETEWENSISYEISGMNDVRVESVVYRVDPAGKSLNLNVYSPLGASKGSGSPTVVFVMGYADDVITDWIGTALKDHPAYHSWGRLVAAAGMVGITYETTDEDDLERVMRYLYENSDELGIDREKIGLWSCSANPPTAIAYLLGDGGANLSFAVFHYAMMSSPDGYMQDLVDDWVVNFDYPPYNPRPVGTIPPNVPIYLGIAGLDFIEFAPETSLHFAVLAAQNGADVIVDFYGQGEHGYDFYDLSARSAGMIRNSLQFMIDATAATDTAAE